MALKLFSLIGACATLLAGASAAPAADRPYLGTWDCEVATFTFTDEVYNNGSEDMPILEAQEGTDGSWTLFFDGDYMIALSGFRGGKMGWMSSSGETLNCRRAG